MLKTDKQNSTWHVQTMVFL